MNAALEIRKTPDGRIQARRKDGKPLTPEDREQARRLAVIDELPPRAWVVEEVRDGETLKAVKICRRPGRPPMAYPGPFFFPYRRTGDLLPRRACRTYDQDPGATERDPQVQARLSWQPGDSGRGGGGEIAPMGEEYLTIAELADRLRLKPKTIKNKMAAGAFRPGVHYFRPPGMQARFKWSAVVAWLEQSQQPGSASGDDSIPMPRSYRLRNLATEKLALPLDRPKQ